MHTRPLLVRLLGPLLYAAYRGPSRLALTGGNVARALALTSLAVVLARTSHASAFAEDVCFLADGRQVDCVELPPECAPGDTSNDCAMGVLASVAARGATDPVGNGGRSSLHVDATYVIAQRLGFSASDAYWLVAYDEATDLGRYVPRDLEGRNLVDPALCSGADAPPACALLTREIDGVVRTNFGSGGVLFHFHAPFHGLEASPRTDVDGLRPDPTNPDVELFLVNMRRWAWGEGLGCAAGLTSASTAGDYATGTSCFARATGRPGNLGGGLAALAGVAVPLGVPTGLQVISTSAAAPITSETLVALVGEATLDEARLGIYLHALQDRVSHHVCGDDSHLTGPYTVVGPRADDFVSDMTSPECTQALHGLRHAWETGVEQALLPARDRTTEAGLAVTWEELEAYASARGFRRADAADARERVLAGLLDALEVPDASERVRAVRDVACGEGLEPMPGHGPCPGETGTDAGLGANDAGPFDLDAAGATRTDAGLGANDAGPFDLDAAGADAEASVLPEAGPPDGSAAPGTAGGGCACTVARGGPARAALACLLLVLGGALQRSRRAHLVVTRAQRTQKRSVRKLRSHARPGSAS